MGSSVIATGVGGDGDWERKISSVGSSVTAKGGRIGLGAGRVN